MLHFEIISDPNKAREVWEIFSPHQRLDDEWEFRELWIKGLDFQLQFIVGYDNDKLIGLLPLQMNTGTGLGAKYLHREKPFLEFFGSIDIDDLQVWVIPGYEKIIHTFLEQIKYPAILSYLKEQYKVNNITATYYLDRFELNLQPFNSLHDFMQINLDGKSRQRLINRINKITKNYTVTIKDCAENDLATLYKLNIERFNERSSFNLQQRRQVMNSFFTKFNVDLFAIELDGVIKAISYGIIFNNVYTTMSIGYDLTIRDISKFLILKQIERAIQKGCSIFDAGKGDNGWKTHFNLTKIPQYTLKLNIEQ